MDLRLPTEGLQNYKSASQRARISSESWAARELCCPRGTSNSLDTLPGNTPVLDFRCPDCESGFQLKSAASAFCARLTDGAYAQMRSAILQGRTPKLFLLHYQFTPFTVASLMFIPDFAFTLSALECRAPLAVTARRAGWIGCNILLNRSLHKSAFHLADVYALENSLARLHPNNSHIRRKIRQQLQLLRDSVY